MDFISVYLILHIDFSHVKDVNQRCRSKAEFGLAGLLFNVLPIVCGSSVFMFCYGLFWVHPSFAIILKRMSKLVALLLLS